MEFGSFVSMFGLSGPVRSFQFREAHDPCIPLLVGARRNRWVVARNVSEPYGAYGHTYNGPWLGGCGSLY